jgi:hypothetical protein
MEFDEMKKIWDTQSNEPLYTLSEKALHKRIEAKKNQARHITNFSELLWIIVNLVAGCFIAGVNFFRLRESLFMYCLAAWMLGTAVYMLASRVRRIRATGRFDRSIRGDLSHALSVATYQVRISQVGRWNILPMGILVIIGVWDSGKSVWWLGGLVIFFGLANYFSRWEHGIYEKRKRELETLQTKLESED